MLKGITTQADRIELRSLKASQETFEQKNAKKAHKVLSGF